ncbi:hypothetical protein [Ruminococcus sp. NK3A76]|uniref:hypothetical protein n=1 Tax=Ruminococcus sp. NK3A76 TaxID=877411 RepID=UPI000ACB34C7|nr:hypothetical protein [Ruminococcus sp. NK3A76]
MPLSDCERMFGADFKGNTARPLCVRCASRWHTKVSAGGCAVLSKINAGTSRAGIITNE